MRYKKARWWGIEPCGYNSRGGDFIIYGVKINYGDWCGRTHLLHNAKMFLDHPRIRRKDRDWLRGVLKEYGYV